MTMWPRSGRAVPTTTAQVARAAFPKGCLAIRIRDALGELFEDAQFAGLFAVRGRPAVSPARLALVSVLQFVEGLSDRQAADAVRGRIDWKYAPGLELADTGVDASQPVSQSLSREGAVPRLVPHGQRGGHTGASKTLMASADR